MKRQRRIMLALTLAFAIVVSGAASLWMWYRLDAQDGASKAAAEAAEDFREDVIASALNAKAPSKELAVSLAAGPVAGPAAESAEAPEEETSAEPAEQTSGEPSEEPVNAASGEPVGRIQRLLTGAPFFVSLYAVEQINDRPRTLEAVSKEAVANSWMMQLTMNAHPDLTYVDTQLGDLPLLEVYKDTGEPRPLLLFLHGLGNDKESFISALSYYAEAGYHAVGMDAFDQGERYSASTNCDTWAAVLITVGDIDPVIEYFGTVENVDTEHFVLAGFSLGAVEAMAYVETGSYKPSALIVLCGVCEYSAWQTWQRDDLTYGWMDTIWRDTVWTFPEQQTFRYTGDKYNSIFSLNVTDNLDCFSDIPILCCIGTSDLYFNARTVQNVIQQIRDNGNTRARCIVYPGAWHMMTMRMMGDSLRFLDALPKNM